MTISWRDRLLLPNGVLFCILGVALLAGCSVVGAVREGKAVTRFDGVTFEIGDTVLVLVSPDQEAAVREILLG